MQHTVDLRHTLPRVLYKEDDIGESQRVVVGAGKTMQHRHVTSHQDTCCLTSMVQGMRGDMIFGQLTHHHPSQRLTDGIITLIGVDGMTHRTMNTDIPCTRLRTQQSGDITESYQQLGITLEDV